MKRNTHRVNNPARLARLRSQAIKLRERVKRSTLAFVERNKARFTWWQRAFRVPMVADWAVFTKAKTLLSAFMALLGLASGKRSSLVALMVEGSAPQASRKGRRLQLEGLEQRQLMATFQQSDSVLNLDLTAASTTLAVTAGANNYTLTLTGGDTWTSSNITGATGSGSTTLTVTKDAFTTINVVDSNTGAAVNFNNSAANTYTDNLSVVLDAATAGTITFAGTTSMTESNSLSVSTSRNIALNAGVTVSTVNGNLTMQANQQATPTSGNFIGINVNGSVVQATGTGIVSVLGKGGDSGLSSQHGVRVASGGTIRGGTTGVSTVVTGVAGGSGSINFNHGVYVFGSSSAITSSGGNVSVTGTGGGGTGTGNRGVGVDVENSAQITAGGAGMVTVTGTGGTGTGGANIGVLVGGATITSGGGNVSVLGTGGTGGTSNDGVFVGVYSTGVMNIEGRITAGGNGTVTVIGSAGAGGSNNGVSAVNQSSTGTPSEITSSGGDVAVTGTGGGTGTSGFTTGVSLLSNSRITAGGTGTVTVTGTGGAGSGSLNRGVFLQTATITSGGGSLSVTGVEGGGLSGTAIDVRSSGAITTATSGGTATVIGNSMNFDGTAVISAQSGSSVTLRQKTNGVAINLGGADAASTLGLTDAELDRVTAGTINIGDTNSGPITISTVISPANDKTLAIGNNLTFASTGGFSSDVGPTAATFEKISVTGSVSITAGATLAVTSTGGYVFNAADSFTFLTNDAVDLITGTFTGPTLTNFLGSTLTAVISYTGGTGNDLVISAPTSANYNFSLSSFSVTEGNPTNTTKVVTLNRNNGSAAEVVGIALNPGAINPATPGTDFTVGPIMVSFAVGETSKEVPIELLGDVTVELNETIALSLTSFSGNGQVGTTNPSATLTITNDDSATLSVGNATVIEGNSGALLLRFPVSLDKPVDVNVSVDYETQDGTATAGSDYVGITTPATLTLNAASNSGTIDITVNGDNTVELDETLHLVLTNLQASGRNVSLAGTSTRSDSSWIQLGSDIDGEAAGDSSGFVTFNAAGDRVAIGATGNDVNGTDSGHVRVYKLDGVTWTKLGGDIDGEAQYDHSGSSVTFNAAGDRIAIGAIRNRDNGFRSGHVRVYQLVGAIWTQLGGDIDGEAQYDYSGHSVTFNATGDRVAIGTPQIKYSDNSSKPGHVRVYQLDGATWTKLGGNIDGEAGDDQSGGSVTFNAAGDRVAIGATGNDGNGPDSGHVRVYKLDGATWTQLGGDIDGEAAGDLSGGSVTFNAAGDRVAIGATGNGPDSGHVRVYKLDGATWTQLGGDIDGKAAGDLSGGSVTFNAAGDRVAIGANGNVSNSGRVRVYKLDGATWTQLGGDIDGEAGYDESGRSVTFNAAGDRVAIGATGNDGNGTNSGHVRVYKLVSGSTITRTGTIISDDKVVVVRDNTVRVAEGATATNGGTFSQPGGAAVEITASVGSITQDNGAGTWSWSYFTTDGPDDSQTVAITASNTQGASSTTTFDLTVDNLAPLITRRNATVAVIAGVTATNLGTWRDVGRDDVTLSASLGNVTRNANGTWNWSLATTAEQDLSQAVTITATDSDGAAAAVTFDLQVSSNALPTADIVDIAPDPRTTAVGLVTVNFSEPVSGVDVNDFRLTRNGSTVAFSGLVVNVTPTQATFDLTGFTRQDGNYVLTVLAGGIVDSLGGVMAEPASDAWSADTTVPRVMSITRVDTTPTNAATVAFNVAFSEQVTGVEMADFMIDATGVSGASVTGVSGSGANYVVTVNRGSGLGTLSIDFDNAAANGVTDAAGNRSNVGYTLGENYSIVSATLSLVLNPATFSENGGTATATLTRGGSLVAPLLVKLTSSDTTEATVPATIVIPANQASVTFPVTAVNDSLPDGTQNVTITASAIAYSPGTASLGVADDELDFGDAPSQYPTTLAQNGARHITIGPRLGADRDAESNGIPSADALGDDNAVSDDEDGAAFGALLASASVSTTGSVTIDLQNADANANYLDGWIDFNQDGDWNDAGEQIFSSQSLEPADGQQSLDFTIPAGSSLGKTYARFRVSTAGGLTATGLAEDGEVEDYQVTISRQGGAAVVVVSSEYSRLIVSLEEADLVVKDMDSDTVVFNQSFASISLLTIQGRPNLDFVQVDFVNGNPIPSGGIIANFDGQDRSLNFLNGGSTFRTNTYRFTGSNKGSVEWDVDGPGGIAPYMVSFTGAREIKNDATPLDVEFQLPTSGANNTATLQDFGTPADGLNYFGSVGSTLTPVVFSEPSRTLTVTRGSANDQFLTSGALPDFHRSLTIGSAAAPFGEVKLQGPITFAAGQNLTVDAGVISLNTENSDLAFSGSGAVMFNAGRTIKVFDGATLVTQDGNITLNANRSDTTFTSNDNGVLLQGGQVQTTGSGQIAIDGHGSGTTASLAGVSMSNKAKIRSTSGAITINGAGSPNGGGSSMGLCLDDSTIESSGGNVTITGTGRGATGIRSDGVNLVNGSIRAGGSGTVRVTGMSSNSAGGSQYGVLLETKSTITSAGGMVTVTGDSDGSGSGAGNVGVQVSQDSVISAGGSGSVTVTGRGGVGSGGFQNGVSVDSNAKITSSGGDVYVTGQSRGIGGGTQNVGVQLQSGGVISAVGAGNAMIQGTATSFATGFNQWGVAVNGAGSAITTVNGKLQVTAKGGGTGASVGNRGVNVEGGGRIAATGGGNVMIDATGGNGRGSNGVLVSEANSTIGTTSGSLTIIASAPGSATDNWATLLQQNSKLESTGGPITLVGDALSFVATPTINAGAGTVTIRPKTDGRAINIVGADDNGQAYLGLSDAELDRITAGTLAIGSDKAGAITLGESLTRSAKTNLLFTTSDNVTETSGSQIAAAGGTVTFTGGGRITDGINSVDVEAAHTTFNLHVAPGGSSPGQLRLSGDAKLKSASNLLLDINGTTAGTQFDQVVVAGANKSLDLASANLVIDFATSFVPDFAQAFRLVDVLDTSSRVMGAFAGMPEGARFNADGQNLTITYRGGDGNDVVVTKNQRPTASAGTMYTVLEGGSVALKAIGSDADGTIASFEWDLDGDGLFGETGTLAMRGSETGANPTFLAVGLKGPSNFTVKVRSLDNDGAKSDVATATVLITNAKPTANAGGPYSVDEGGKVTLAATGNDPSLTFEWDLDDDGKFGETGADAARGDEIGRNAVLNAANLDGPTSVELKLRVRDAESGVSDETRAMVQVKNVPPTANAGGPYGVTIGKTVTLSGSAVGMPAEVLTYAWDLDGDGQFGETGSSATRGDESIKTPTFSAAGLSASSVIVSLHVSDNHGGVSPVVTSTVEVTSKDFRAKAGGPYSVGAGGSVTLDGSIEVLAGSVPSPIYQWDLDGDDVFGETGVNAANGNETGQKPTLNARRLVGASNTVSLRVLSGTQLSDVATATVKIANDAPSAFARGPYIIDRQSSIRLEGLGSDPGGDPLTFVWDLDGDGQYGETGAAATRGNETGAEPVYQIGDATGAFTAVVGLRVRDDKGVFSKVSETLVSYTGNKDFVPLADKSKSLGEKKHLVIRATTKDVKFGEVQEVSLFRAIGDLTAGKFTLSFNGATTRELSYNATTADVESALVALGIVPGDIIVTKPINEKYRQEWQLKFQGTQANTDVAQTTIAFSGLDGVTATQKTIETVFPDAEVRDKLKELDDFTKRNSYGKTSYPPAMATLVPGVMTVQFKLADINDSGKFHDEAVKAAIALNPSIKLENFDFVTVIHPSFKTSSSYATYGGVALGTASNLPARMNMQNNIKVGTWAHEFAHSLGLGYHADYFDPVDTTAILSDFDPAALNEYGNYFDIMGTGTKSYLNKDWGAFFKTRLHWWSLENVRNVVESGDFQLHALDDGDLKPNRLYGLQIKRNDQSEYWLQHRTIANADYPGSADGLFFDVRFPQETGGQKGGGETSAPMLIDLTPGSKKENKQEDGLDGLLAINRTYFDPVNKMYVTVTGRHEKVKDDYLHVVINLGDFPFNEPPTGSIKGDSSTLVDQKVTLTADPSDPNGDETAIVWDFADGTTAARDKSVTHRWTKAGQYVVKAYVSDMKGGVAELTHIVQVGQTETRIKTVPDSATTTIGKEVLMNVSANDDKNTLPGQTTLLIHQQPKSGGTASIQNNQVLFTPDKNFRGTTSFVYGIIANGVESRESVNVTVKGDANRPPLDIIADTLVIGDGILKGDMVANLTTIDVDPTFTGGPRIVPGSTTLSIVDDPSKLFTLDGNSLKWGNVSAASLKQARQTVTIRATDAGTPPLSIEKKFTFTLADTPGDGRFNFDALAKGGLGGQFNGTQANEESGYRVETGDLNGDGFDDLIVGAWTFDIRNETKNSGAAYVVYGSANGVPSGLVPGQLDGKNGFSILGLGADLQFATDLDVADVNGDKIDDLLIGAPGTASKGGRVYVLFGKKGGMFNSERGVDLNKLDGTNGFVIRDIRDDGVIGRQVSHADINGDGADDIVMTHETTGATNPESLDRVLVVFGRLKGNEFPSAITSLANGAGFSVVDYSTVTNVYGIDRVADDPADLNGDGIDDLILSNRKSDVPEAAFVVFGSKVKDAFDSDKNDGADAPIKFRLTSLNGANGFKLTGPTGVGFATALSGVPDINGDGVADLVVGAPESGSGRGEAYVVFGKKTGFAATLDVSALNGTNGFTFVNGTGANTRFGSSFSGGDFNGDGLADLAVGAPREWSKSQVAVLYGKKTAFASRIDVSSLTGVNGFVASSDFFSASIGDSVSLAGDLNGDGRKDLVVGSSKHFQTEQGSAGATFVLSGGDYLGNPRLLAAVGGGSRDGDKLRGNSSSQSFFASLGDDVIDGGGGEDVIDAGPGDDQILVPDLAFTMVAGGPGTDLLKITTANNVLDLAKSPNITGIEVFNIIGASPNTMIVDPQSAASVSDDNTLTVIRDDDDTVVLQGDWTPVSTESVDGNVFNSFTSGAVSLFVQKIGVDPVAVANGVYSVPEGGSIVLSSAGTTDEHTETLLYTWDLDGDGLFGETGSAAAHGNENVANPTFLATGLDSEDQVTVSLRVRDQDLNTSTATAIVQVTNVAPTVQVGGPFSGLSGSVIQLLASATDPAGAADPLTFAWDLDGDGLFGETGSAAVRGNETGMSPRFNTTGLTGQQTVQLRVEDGDGGSVTESVAVSVQPRPAGAPFADAGAGYSVLEGGTLALNAAASTDPDHTNSQLTFVWDLDGDGLFGETGSDAFRGNETGAAPTFNADGIDGPASVLVSLRVTDPASLSDIATAWISVLNATPVANAGSGYVVAENLSLQLNGSASDGGGAGESLSYFWDLDGDGQFGETGGTATAGDEIGTTPTFIPNYDGPTDVVVRLFVVDDEDGVSQIVTTTVQITNSAPTALIAGDFIVQEGCSTLLAASGGDAASDALTFEWDLDGDGLFGETGADAAFGDETGASPTFLAAGIDGHLVVPIAMRVRDDDGSVSLVQVGSVLVVNVAPTADAGEGYLVQTGSSIVLSGSAFDPGGDSETLVFEWDLDDDGVFGETGVDAANGDELGSNPTYFLPPNNDHDHNEQEHTQHEHFVSLRVRDDDGAVSEIVTTTIDKNDKGLQIDAGVDRSVHVGESLSLFGIAQMLGVGEDEFVFEWDLDGDDVFGETGSDAANGDETEQSPTFTANSFSNGHAHVHLRVTATPFGLTVEDELHITVVAFPVIAFSQATFTTDEQAGNSLAVTLTRTGDTSGISQVTVGLSGGTATAGSDFDSTGFPLIVTFAPNETVKSVLIPVLRDTLDESTETIELTASAGTGSTLGTQVTATLNLENIPLSITLGNSNIAENVTGLVVGQLLVDGPNPGALYQLSVADVRFEIVSGTLKLKPGNSIKLADGAIVVVGITAKEVAAPGREVTESFTLKVTANSRPWRYSAKAVDSNGDGSVDPLDVLRIVNQINAPTILGPGGRLPDTREANLPYYDVNGDEFCDLIDVLTIINFINADYGNGEGEFVANANVAMASFTQFVYGGIGNDYFRGAYINDMLIEKYGEDELRRGRDNALLIGSSTENQDDLTSLDAALADWSGSDWSLALVDLGGAIHDDDKDDMRGNMGIDIDLWLTADNLQ